MKTPLEIFEGSNGDDTKELYAVLEKLGPVGFIAMNLFRACKCSGRAKVYKGRGSAQWKGNAYDRKNWSLANLCFILAAHAEPLGIRWGWKEDAEQEFHRWVLYVEIPTGQVSFHSEKAMCDVRFAGDWDGKHQSAPRIVAWVTQVLANTTP